MSKLGQQFSQLRESTPKYVQWLLLGVAFIVVLILLTLLVTKRESKATKASVDEVPVQISLFVANNGNETPVTSIDWANVTVGTKKTETITVKSNIPAKVSIGQNKQIPGFKSTTTCDAAVINNKILCRIFLEYMPATVTKPETLLLSVYYRGENEPESMKKSDKVTVVLGSVAPEIKTPEPIIKPEPIVEPEPIVIPEPKQTIREEIETIAPTITFADTTPEPQPVVKTVSESCSDFAFPGYDGAGNQIGWIKPERGAYYFHPFSDRECKNATGIYNPTSGVITDINGGGKRIGTDAEHIGFSAASGTLPLLNDAPNARKVAHMNDTVSSAVVTGSSGLMQMKPAPIEDVIYDTTDPSAIVSSQPYDRTFILRQYKPIPATIVSDVRADTALDRQNLRFPVRATVDRNVYSDNGRTVIIPTGTLLLGYVTGEVPGPYKAIGRMNISWYQFVLPNGVEFNFQTEDEDPVSADAQGRIGVPGRGSTDYLEQFVMPMLTAIVPAAVNMIAPVADKFVNQIDLDNNTVVQSGTMRSSELAKNEIITAWNQVAQKLLVDMMDNTVPPFTIPAGTRITVYSPHDLMVACTNNTKCMVRAPSRASRRTPAWNVTPADDGSWVGQARSFNLEQYCTPDANGIWGINKSISAADITMNSGYSYSTVLGYCQSLNYQAINMARQKAIYQNQQSTSNTNSIASKNANPSAGVYTKEYNEQVLGLEYNADGSIKNPYQSEPKSATEQPAQNIITCEDGLAPDANGCCTGEIYTDMGEQGFNCCPQTGGDCFPPIL